MDSATVIRRYQERMEKQIRYHHPMPPRTDGETDPPPSSIADFIKELVSRKAGLFLSGFSEIKSNIEDLKSKLEKEGQNFSKALSKSSKECENLLKNESAKFQAIYEKFSKEKATHLHI
nr:DNA ligase 1 [Ipomoea batatas]GME04461.1 DNA ligase 1 [Ipomoea batatas]